MTAKQREEIQAVEMKREVDALLDYRTDPQYTMSTPAQRHLIDFNMAAAEASGNTGRDVFARTIDELAGQGWLDAGIDKLRAAFPIVFRGTEFDL